MAGRDSSGRFVSGGGSFQWHGEEVKALIHAELTRRLNRAALVVWNHAKELINVEGTGVRAETSSEAGLRAGKERFRAKVARNRAAIKEHNALHGSRKKGGTGLISEGVFKRARLTKAGGISFRRAPLRNNDASGFAKRHRLKGSGDG